MTYLNIKNNNDDCAQIDIGNDVDDVWDALYSTHEDMWDLVGDDIIIEITEVFMGSASEVCTLDELKTFLNVEVA